MALLMQALQWGPAGRGTYHMSISMAVQHHRCLESVEPRTHLASLVVVVVVVVEAVLSSKESSRGVLCFNTKDPPSTCICHLSTTPARTSTYMATFLKHSALCTLPMVAWLAMVAVRSNSMLMGSVATTMPRTITVADAAELGLWCRGGVNDHLRRAWRVEYCQTSGCGTFGQGLGRKAWAACIIESGAEAAPNRASKPQ